MQVLFFCLYHTTSDR